MIAIGFVIRRARWLTAEADHSLLRATVNLFYPCLIADTIIGNPALKNAGNLALPPLVGLGTCFLGFGLCWLGARAMRLSRGKEARTFVYSTGMYNYGYTAIPIIEAVFDKQTMGVLFTHNLGAEVSIWIGASLILAAVSPRREWRKILNAPVIAIIICVVLNFCGARTWLPDFSLRASHSLGQCAVPLALVLTGATYADFIAELHPRGGLHIATGACLLRNGILPLFFLAIAKWLPCSVELKHVIVVQAAMPAAMMPIIIAKHYNGDPKIALQVVLFTSIAAFATIPFWIRAGLAFIGV